MGQQLAQELRPVLGPPAAEPLRLAWNSASSRKARAASRRSSVAARAGGAPPWRSAA
jgi:hypothetical protein